MKVYLARVGVDYEGDRVVSVHTTKEGADKAASEEYARYQSYDFYAVDEYDVVFDPEITESNKILRPVLVHQSKCSDDEVFVRQPNGTYSELSFVVVTAIPLTVGRLANDCRYNVAGKAWVDKYLGNVIGFINAEGEYEEL